jgi:hypothetical protein
MGQSGRGVTHAMEAQVHPLLVFIPRFIDPSALMAVKAIKVE